jgi:acetyl-CoA synthetase
VSVLVSFLGYYFTGDGARRDKDGYYWITGRVDDVINPSGHRIGTAEIESALVECHEVAEAAVIGFPHDIKGEGIGCFIILKEGQVGDSSLTMKLKNAVRGAIGPIATPDFIVYCDLPKVTLISHVLSLSLPSGFLSFLLFRQDQGRLCEGF